MDIKTEFTERIRISPAMLKWVKQNKGDKTAAAFLDEVIKEFIKPNLFNKKKGK